MLSVRPLNADDAESVFRIGSTYSAFDLTPTNRFFPPDYLHRWFSDAGEDVLLGAFYEDKLIGFVLCQIVRRTWAVWHNLYVLSEYRKTGTGQILYESAMSILAERGVLYCSAYSRDEEAIRFHLNNGATAGQSFRFIDWFVPTGSGSNAPQE
jgi:GNAT superfamily N-acetyltransferase